MSKHVHSICGGMRKVSQFNGAEAEEEEGEGPFSDDICICMDTLTCTYRQLRDKSARDRVFSVPHFQ